MSGEITQETHPEGFVRIDPESGEIVRECPNCAELEGALSVTERKLRAAYSQISKLEQAAEPEKHAKKHPLYVEIEAVHTWWRLATGHFGVSFTAEDFDQALPRWKENSKRGANPCIPALKAVVGAAFDPNTTTRRNGSEKRYDDWELIFRNQTKFREMQKRAPAADSEHGWKKWLVTQIESNLT